MLTVWLRTRMALWALVLCSVPVAWATTSTPAARSAAPALVLGTPSTENTFAGSYLRRIYRELSLRSGVPMDITTLPVARLSLEVAQDRLDGDTARALAFAQTQPQLIRVGEPLMEVQLALWATDPRVKLARLEDLGASGYTVTYPRGMLICENALKPQLPAGRLVDVTGAVQAIEMMHYGRNALHCGIDISVLSEAQESLPSKPLPLRVLNIGKPMPLYLYLQPRHAALVPGLLQALRRMRQDGTQERLRRETLQAFQFPAGSH
jgi:polar amino acid transport system substrate-binding protein